MKKKEINIGEDKLTIIPLGAGCEVGRSCIVLKFQNKVIMFDCGIHPSDNDLSSLPFFDLINPQDVDLLLVTHFHLDHCGSVPYFLEKTKFKGKTYMTYPTKAIYKQVVLDSLKVGMSWDKRSLFSRDDILNSMEKIEAINFHEQIEHDGVKFVAYNAGHVIGAAMFLLEINGVRILYTGDYSREEDIHLRPAEIPNCKIDVLIVESTYGIKNHEPRKVREKLFLDTVERIVQRKGKCLLPVFVLGRAQELLLLLEQQWTQKPELQHIPVYYASTMMSKCMLIFQTYVNMMGQEIQEKMKKGQNPFVFKFISVLDKMNVAEETKPMVVMAAPGMLQKGLSRNLFQKWCHDEKNGVLFTGYCVEGTFARDILNGMKTIYGDSGLSQKIKMSVEYISFSAHADFDQTKDFIDKVQPSLVVLVHGEKYEAMRLKKKLEETFEDNIKFEAPENWEEVVVKMNKKLKADIQGSIMDEQIINKAKEEDSKVMKGLFVRKQYKNQIISEKDTEKLLDEKIYFLDQKVNLFFPYSIELVFYLVSQVIPDSSIVVEDDQQQIVARKSVKIYKKTERQLILEWRSSKINDIIGDCIGYMLYNISMYEDIDAFEKSDKKQSIDKAQKQKEDIELIYRAIEQNCGSINVQKMDKKIIVFNQDRQEIIVINEENFQIEKSSNDLLKNQINNIIRIVRGNINIEQIISIQKIIQVILIFSIKF